jgi:hypothetical protein
LRAALVRGWTGGYVLTEGGELAFIRHRLTPAAIG